MSYLTNKDPDFGDEVVLQDANVHPAQLYHYLLKVEAFPHYLWPAYQFAKHIVNTTSKPHDLPKIDPENIENWVKKTVRWNEMRAATDIEHLPEANAYITKQISPFYLTEGCWLQGATALVHAERKSGIIAQELAYLRSGNKLERALFDKTFQEIFEKTIGQNIQCFDEAFIKDCDLEEQALEYALIGITMGRFPSNFLPEIAGYNLWHACVGVKKFKRHLSQDNDQQLPEEAINNISLSVSLIKSLLSENSRDQHEIAARIETGFALGEQAWARFYNFLAYRIHHDTPEAKMLSLLEKKAPFAFGYHGHIKVGSETLDDLFDSIESKKHELLSYFIKSKMVSRDHPKQSRLIRLSTNIKSPMYGIFTHDELKVIEDWAQSISSSKLASHPKKIECPSLVGNYVAPLDPVSFSKQSEQRYSICGERVFCFHLANSDRFPLVRPYSVKVSQHILKQLSQLAKLTKPNQAPPSYSIHLLDQILKETRETHMAVFENTDFEYLEGKNLIDKYVAAYPSYCTDASWLDGCVNIANRHLEEYQLMFEIYRDENGNGHFENNHNVIARKLLASMDCELPSLKEEKFFVSDIQAAGFLGTLIKYALAINTDTFLPEVLAVNLVVETNGVGWKYRHNSRELQRENYDPHYMDLHVSVDNFASGHSALARRAIITFLDRAKRYGTHNQKLLWSRIWNTFYGLQTLLDHSRNETVSAYAKNILSAVNIKASDKDPSDAVIDA